MKIELSQPPDTQKPQQIKSATAQCLVESLNVIGLQAGNSQFQPR